MGGKQQGGGTAPTIRPRGPAVGGPNAGGGPPLVSRITGPMNTQAMRNMNSFKDTAAPIVGAIAGIITSMTPAAPLAGLASSMADRTVREQTNVVNGRPFFEGVGNNGAPTWGDLASLIGGVVAGGAGSYAGSAVTAGTGSALAGTAANQATRAGVSYGLGQGAAALDRRVPIGGRRRAPTPIGGYGQPLPMIYGGYGYGR